MKSYHLLISEPQRVMLEMLIASRIVQGGLLPELSEELALWVGMLRDLPTAEAMTPGALHGFCL